MTEKMNVCVIIPTYNRHKLLAEVLPSYLKQRHVREVILVDDGSNTAIQEMLDDFNINDKRILVIRHTRSLGSCSARNSGIFEARSPWVFFGEDDLVLSDDHIENLHKDRVLLGADIICGNLIQQEIDESLQDSYKRITDRCNLPVFNNRLITINYGSIAKPIELPFCHAIFMAPTEILKKYLFTTRIGGPSFMREDLEIQLILRKAGYRLFATPNAIAYHFAKSKSHGSGTRLDQSVLAFATSAAVNTWQVINQHYETITPFFNNISRKSMVRRAVFWTFFLEIKRRMQVKYSFFDKIICNLRRFC